VPSVVLVRHAQGTFGGVDYDVLTELGRRQVDAVANALARRGLRIERVVSGSLRRQLDTAAPIAAAAGRQVEVDARWNEYETAGILEAHSSSGAREERRPADDAPPISSREFQRLLDAALAAWIAASGTSGAPERWPAFAGRVEAALRAVSADLTSGGAAIVVTSGGPIATVCSRLLELEPQAMVPFNRVTLNTGMTTVSIGRGGLTLVSFNEHQHLTGSAAALRTYR